MKLRFAEETEPRNVRIGLKIEIEIEIEIRTIKKVH